MRILVPLAAALGLSACTISTVNYGETPWTEYIEGPGCPVTGPAIGADLPHFLVTSRLPDCRSDPAELTVQRGDQIRYGRFGRPEQLEMNMRKPPERARFALQEEAEWWDQLSAAARANDGKLLIYVHGFNELLPSTTKDAADMASFTGFEGPVVHYSWPSRGEVLSYTVDENNADYEEEYFSAIVNNIASLPDVTNITLVAHSMGARLAIPAIEHLDRSNDRPIAAKLGNVILASPDYDSGLFMRKLQHRLLNPRKAPAGRRITVYTSREDIAVGLSRLIHGYARLGNPKCDDPVAERNRPSGEKPPRCYPELPGQVEGLAIVDTTSISDSNNGHNDFLRTRSGCADFTAVVHGGPAWPGRRAMPNAPGYVWQLSPTAGTGICRMPLAPAE